MTAHTVIETLPEIEGAEFFCSLWPDRAGARSQKCEWVVDGEYGFNYQQLWIHGFSFAFDDPAAVKAKRTEEAIREVILECDLVARTGKRLLDTSGYQPLSFAGGVNDSQIPALRADNAQIRALRPLYMRDVSGVPAGRFARWELIFEWTLTPTRGKHPRGLTR